MGSFVLPTPRIPEEPRRGAEEAARLDAREVDEAVPVMAAHEAGGGQPERLDQPVVFDLRGVQRAALVEAGGGGFAGGGAPTKQGGVFTGREGGPVGGGGGV